MYLGRIVEQSETETLYAPAGASLHAIPALRRADPRPGGAAHRGGGSSCRARSPTRPRRRPAAPSTRAASARRERCRAEAPAFLPYPGLPSRAACHHAGPPETAAASLAAALSMRRMRRLAGARSLALLFLACADRRRVGRQLAGRPAGAGSRQRARGTERRALVRHRRAGPRHPGARGVRRAHLAAHLGGRGRHRRRRSASRSGCSPGSSAAGGMRC